MKEYSSGKYSFKEFFERMVLSKRFIRYLNPEIVQEECRYQAENDLAYVNIEVPYSVVTERHRDIAATFTGKIGALGNMLDYYNVKYFPMPLLFKQEEQLACLLE